MRKYELHLFMRGVDWYLFFFLAVVTPLGCLGFMAAAVLTLIIKRSLRESLEMAIFAFFCIVIEGYLWDIYIHLPHAIFVDHEEECLYLKRIFGKPSAIPIREIQEVRTHFWFMLIYFPAFMGFKKVIVAESLLPGGFFIISPFFKKWRELISIVLKEEREKE